MTDHSRLEHMTVLLGSKFNLSIYQKKIRQIVHGPNVPIYNSQYGSRQWGAGNVYLLVLSSWKVNIAENPIALIGL